MAKALATGAIVGGSYELAELLGSGGMGEVWAATHRVTGREVAIKCLRASAYSDPYVLERFQREARAACAVDHPNVVDVLDFAERDGEEPMIIMERLRGETLAAKIAREESLSFGETATLMVQVISAVGTAHALGIVHRDLKPSNIFILRRARDPADTVKVLDFGIAKWLNVQDGRSGVHTKSGSTLGTPCYMAPEQALANTPVDHRADVWALGVILYECLTGVRPVEGENSAQVVLNLFATGIIPVEKLATGVPSDVAELIRRMLTREASGRPRDLRAPFALLSRYTNIVSPVFSEPSGQPGTPDEPDRKLPEVPPTLVRHEPETVIPTTTTANARVAARRRGNGRAARLFGVTLVVGTLALFWFARARDSGDGAGSAVARPPPVRPAPDAPAFRPTPVATPETSRPSFPAASAAPAQRAPTPVRSEPQRATRPAQKPRALSPRSSATPAAAATGSVVAPSRAPGLHAGEACEKSSDCESKKCVAFACQ